jgi:hypothetical protein
MPLFTVYIDRKPIVTIHGDREFLMEDLAEDQGWYDLYVYMTTWTVRGKPVWDGDMKRVDIRLAAPKEAARFQANMLEWQSDHPNEKPNDDVACLISAAIDRESLRAANQRLQLNHAPGRDGSGNVVPLH